MRTKIIAGNWKMNVKPSETAALVKGIIAAAQGVKNVDIVVYPPAIDIPAAAKACGKSPVKLGAENAHWEDHGAFTGEIAANMLVDAGVKYCIVGHSERRADYGESDLVACGKAEAVLRAGLTAIVCVGETRAEREAGKTLAVVRKQVKNSLPEGANRWNTVIAYEPVWAIGTGLTPTVADVAEVHADIRKSLGSALGKDSAGRMRILYGGSVKPDNAKALMAVENVDGALIGGASLKAVDFLAIAAAYR